jgi:PGF-CTERM protein
MKDNYKDGTADFAGKTISEAKTVTLVSDTVKIEANKDSVVRSNAFSVTVTGKPNQIYFLWVKGTRSLNGNIVNSMPPYIIPSQTGVTMDTAATTNNVLFPGIWNYVPQNMLRTLSADVAPGNCWTYYCRILTNENGVRTIEWMTSNWTKAQTYNIRVENQTPGVNDWRTDEVSVKVEKGAVTITASGDGSYYLGEEVKFSGTNTESKKTYLFIIGPNLNPNGSNIDSLDPRLAANAVVNNVPTTFKVVDVLGDNTWSWKWGTALVALDAGTYTVYAVSAPNDRNTLADVAYGTVSIIIKKPFVSATVSQSTLAQGDKLYVRGTAEGKPNMGVMMWVLGKNYVRKWTTSVESDASFEFDQMDEAATANLAAGQYFVVVQHPMQNDQFDIDLCADAGVAGFTNNEVCNLQLTGAGTKIFTVLGAGSLQGSDAAEALVQGINDPNVDDTYTKLQFLVEEPVINIDTIGDRHVGDKFTITAKTNLAVDDEVLFEVYSSSFKPTQKSQSGEFSGATGTVKVTKGDTGMNQLAFDVDASTFKPDEYIVTASAVIQTVTGTALFNVLEGAAPTAAVTTAAPTAAVTTAAATTAAPTTAAPTKTPTQPGFGALIALIGLGAVAFLVVRRH